MADTNESTKAKSAEVTSVTKASRQNSNVPLSTSDGNKRPTDARAEAAKISELLARMKDVTHTWPCRLLSGKMPAPLIRKGYIVFAFPLGGHVIENSVTSEGKQNFTVDGTPVIPVTSTET
jgi:hypothetical protein